MRYLVLVIAIAGCVEHGSGGPPPDPSPDPEEVFEQKALPVLQARCAECHATLQSPRFLEGETAEEIHANLLASGVINLEAPTASRLLTKGQHSGPQMNATETSVVLEWVEAERLAQ